MSPTEQAPEAVPPPCRICHRRLNVAIYREEAPEQTVCVYCCEHADHADGEHGHVFAYQRSEGHTCNYCGIDRNCTDFDYSEDDDR